MLLQVTFAGASGPARVPFGNTQIAAGPRYCAVGGRGLLGAAAARALAPLALAPSRAAVPGAGAVVTLAPTGLHAFPLLLRSQLREATQDCGLWRREFDREYGETGPLQASPVVVQLVNIRAPGAVYRAPGAVHSFQQVSHHVAAQIYNLPARCIALTNPWIACQAGGGSHACRRLEGALQRAPCCTQGGRALAEALFL